MNEFRIGTIAKTYIFWYIESYFHVGYVAKINYVVYNAYKLIINF